MTLVLMLPGCCQSNLKTHAAIIPDEVDYSNCKHFIVIKIIPEDIVFHFFTLTVDHFSVKTLRHFRFQTT